MMCVDGVIRAHAPPDRGSEEQPRGVWRRDSRFRIVLVMRTQARRSLVLLTCLALLAIGAALFPRAAAASDDGDPLGAASAAQTVVSSATAPAVNENTTTQDATVAQNGGDGGGGQSQSVTQVAPTVQSAAAAATSSQAPTNMAAGGAADGHGTSAGNGQSGNSKTKQQT